MMGRIRLLQMHYLTDGSTHYTHPKPGTRKFVVQCELGNEPIMWPTWAQDVIDSHPEYNPRMDGGM